MRKPRPVGVWLVLAYVICNILLAHLLVHFAGPRLLQDPRQKAYQEHLTAFDHVAIALFPLIWEAAIILFFFLRKLAGPLMALALGINLAIDIHLALTTEWLVLLRRGIYVVAFFNFIDLAILLYALRLRRKGVLS